MTAKVPLPRNTMADWLALHRVNAQDVHRFLDLTVPFLKGHHHALENANPNASHGLSAQAAWALCAEALDAQAGPDLAPAIVQAHNHSHLVLGHLPKGGPRAVTLPDGGDGQPLVTCPFDGVAKDLITMMHEFGHAVQIVASEDRFMPPVLRETCAFAAEEALLAHLAAIDHPLLAPIQAGWQRETARILQAPLTRLYAALDDPDTSYNYIWNYPLARGVQVKGATLGLLFQGQLSLADLADQ